MPDIDYAQFGVLSRNKKRQQQVTDVSNAASFDLSAALDSANTELIGIQKTHHEEQTHRLQSSNMLLQESDLITQDIRRAEADPWHDIKVLFTDEKSIGDLAADQNLIQNGMNSLSRANQQSIYKYQFDLTKIQNSLAFANKKRENALFDVNATAAQASATVRQVEAKRVFFDEQLNAMPYEQLIQLRGDLQAGKRNDFDDFSVEMKIREWDDKIIKSKTSGAEKIQKMAKDWELSIPRAELNASIRNNSGDLVFKVPGTELAITYNHEMQLAAQAAQATAKDERAEGHKKFVSNTTDVFLQQEHFENMMMRYLSLSPSAEMFTTDANGETVLDFSSLPGSTPELTAQLTGVDSAIRGLQRQLRGFDKDSFSGGATEGMSASNTSDAVADETVAQIQVLGMKRQELYLEMEKQVLAEAQKPFQSEAGKQTVADYIQRGFVSPHVAETRIALSESLVNNASAGTAFGGSSIGYRQGLATLSAATREEYRKAAEGSGDEIFKLFQAEGEDSKQAAMAALFNNAPKLKVAEIQMRSLNKTAGGVNMHQTATLTAWNKDALRQGFEWLKSKHANEKATLAVLEPFMTARNHGQMQPRYINSDTGMLDLMVDLSNRSFIMHEQSALDPTQNLARELQEYMLSPEFYASPGILNMTKPKSLIEAEYAASVFGNNHSDAFKASFSYNLAPIGQDGIFKTPAYDKETNIQALATSMMKQRGIPVTDEAGYNDILHEIMLQRRNKNPLRQKAINTRKQGPKRRQSSRSNANR